MMTSTISKVISILTLLLITSILANPFPLNSTSSQSITTYISLGDSYASGNGAGNPIHTWPHPIPFCGRFSSAYPLQLAQTLSPVRFRSEACGGASITTVIWDQFSWIPRDADLVTLTVGGNEVDFFSVLNECVYLWHPTGTCERELRRSKELIEKRGFVEGYEEMVRVGVQRMRKEGRFLVTGYARFFNETTTECDGITFARKRPGQYLTRSLRRELNQLVSMLNNVILSATEANGAEYVDIDEIFQGHRFCEEGVNEPDISRKDTWFFNLDYDSDDEHAQEVLSARWGKGFVDITRVFHPTKEGHAGIRDAIVKHL